MAKKKETFQRKQTPIRTTRSQRRTLIKKDGELPDGYKKGVVISSIGRVYLVGPTESDSDNEANIIECSPGGTIVTPHQDTTIIAVGDEVAYIESGSDGESDIPSGVIVKVYERKNSLSRRAAGKRPYEHVIASNADQLLITSSMITPDFNRRLIDRFLVAAEIGGIPAALCVNKCDLVDDDIFYEQFEVYDSLGIDVFFISAKENLNIETIQDYLEGKRTIFAGQSGVGKSTLLNRILGGEVQAVKEISERTGKGCHTTSYVKMFRIPGGTSIIDTPGIREFGLWGVEKSELALYFHEFDEYRLNCKYPSCSHIHEPGCLVQQAFVDGLIDEGRYESYIYLFESMED